MYPLSSRASDAGPAGAPCTCANALGDPCRVHDSSTCAHCGNRSLETVRCQGVDDCDSEICWECRELSARQVQCCVCELPACPEHLALVDGELMCEICRKEKT
jgi:hypothetical protein